MVVFVCDFEFRSLEFTCFLGFVIWNFHKLNNSVNEYNILLFPPL
jgi:hypothetical protein